MGTGKCTSKVIPGAWLVTCCWREKNTGTIFSPANRTCQTCKESPTLTEEPAPICEEGQVLDEQTNLCVLEESDVSGEETEQQSSEEDSSEGNSNDDNDDDENN